MSKAQLVITAVVLEGRSKSEVARDDDVSPRRRRGMTKPSLPQGYPSVGSGVAF
jgi:hypothetical protein